MKYIFYWVTCVLSFIILSCENTDVNSEKTIDSVDEIQEDWELNGPYFGLEPTEVPQILANDFISTALTEYNGTFSPDGTEFYYTSEVGGIGYITFSELDSTNRWTQPEIASFSGQFSEYDPLFAPDGSRLYYSSERPLVENQDWNPCNIWYVDRAENGWATPIHVPLTGNGDYYSSLTTAGNIYFNCWNTGKILKAVPSDTAYITEELPEIINSRSDVGDPFIAPNEDYLIYRAYYNEGFGNGDLYISFKIDEEWTAPENLGKPINSSGHEMCPFVTTDGQFFVFASNRLSTDYSSESLNALQQKFGTSDNGQSNIYYQSTDFIADMKVKYLTGEE